MQRYSFHIELEPHVLTEISYIIDFADHSVGEFEDLVRDIIADPNLELTQNELENLCWDDYSNRFNDFDIPSSRY
ncbi:MAG: hypothetical protein M0P09_06735 [Acholeplasmataceae bacterium]|nr:hypothetical protein [Acholeplasmataceae bacterium]